MKSRRAHRPLTSQNPAKLGHIGFRCDAVDSETPADCCFAAFACCLARSRGRRRARR